MQLERQVAVVTGGAQGIGRALCERFAREGATVVVADLDPARAAEVAGAIGGQALGCDVTDGAAVAALVDAVIRRHERIDLFCCNAGIMVEDRDGTPFGASDRDWQRSWDVNVMGHVHAARAVVPHMQSRGSGTLLNIVSAAGLLNQLGAAAYTATKHAALAFSEALAIDLSDSGIRVAAVCPQYVATDMIGLSYDEHDAESAILSPAQVADAVMSGLAAGDFLILPHPQVADLARAKVGDLPRYLSGMRRLRARVLRDDGSLDWSVMRRSGQRPKPVA